MIVRGNNPPYLSLWGYFLLLSDEEHFTIILSAIRDYEQGVTDIGILLVEKVIAQIIACVDTHFSTQDVFDEIIEVFDFYNDFITTKNIEMKTIPDEMKDLVQIYINEVIKDVGEVQTESTDNRQD